MQLDLYGLIAPHTPYKAKRMIQAQLVQRRALAIQAIGELLGISFEGMPKAINSEHGQLFTLERIAETLKNQSGKAETAVRGFTLDEILAVEGLSKTSQKALQAAFDGSCD